MASGSNDDPMDNNGTVAVPQSFQPAGGVSERIQQLVSQAGGNSMQLVQQHTTLVNVGPNGPTLPSPTKEQMEAQISYLTRLLGETRDYADNEYVAQRLGLVKKAEEALEQQRETAEAALAYQQECFENTARDYEQQTKLDFQRQAHATKEEVKEKFGAVLRGTRNSLEDTQRKLAEAQNAAMQNAGALNSAEGLLLQQRLELEGAKADSQYSCRMASRGASRSASSTRTSSTSRIATSGRYLKGRRREYASCQFQFSAKDVRRVSSND